MTTHRWPGILLVAALLMQSAFPALAAPASPRAAPSAALFPPWYSLLAVRSDYQSDLLPARPADPSVVEITVVGTGAPLIVSQSTPPGTVLERAAVLEDGGATWFSGGLAPGQAGTLLWVSGDRVGLGPGLAPGRTARLALVVRPADSTPTPAGAIAATGAPRPADIGPLQSGDTTLAIAKSDSPDPVAQGADLAYTLVVTNTGSVTATQVFVTDTTPVGTVFASAAVLDGGGALWFHGGLSPGGSGTYTWFTGDLIGIGSGLAPGVRALLQFVVRPVVPTEDQTVLHNNQYGARAANAPFVPGADVTTTVNAPAFALGKVAATDPITAGARLTYTVFLTNTGSLTTTGPYTIGETLPANTTYADSVPPASVDGNTLTWVLSDPIPPGGATQVTFAVTVTAPLTDGTPIVNTDYRATSAEVTPTAHGAPVTVTVRSWPTLSVAKADTPDPVQAGAPVTYTLTVTNAADALGPALGTVVTDTLPSYVQFVSCSDGCSHAAGTVTWTLGTLGVGQSRTLTLVGRVFSPLPNGTVLTNTAGVSATNALAAATVSEATTVSSAPAFAVAKTVYPTAVVAGSVVTYTITVTNTGNETAPSATVTDTLPAGFTFGGMVQGPAPSVSGSDLIWTGLVVTGTVWPPGWLAPPGPLTLVFTATAGGSGTQYNAVTVTQDAVSAATGSTAPVFVGAPDLAITKRDSPDPATPGQPLAYTLRYTNTSPVPATGVVVTDTLPDFIVGGYASPPPSSGTIAAGQTVTWTLGTLGGNSSGSIQLVVTLTVPIADGTVLTNTAGIACAEGVSAQTGPVTTTVRSAPAFAVSKTASHNPVHPGDRVTFTIAVTNTGTENATGVVITDALPAHTAFADATPPYTGPTDGVLTWTVGTLNVGAAAVYTLAVTVDFPLTSGLQLVNWAFVSSAQGVTGSAAATVTVQSAPVLSLAKADGPDPVPSLGTLVYTLTFTNTGDAVATGVWLTDTLPAGVTFASASPTPTYQSGPTVAWNWPGLSPLAGLQTVVLTVTVGLLPDGTVLTNTALLKSDQTGPVTATATTTVQTADLVAGKGRVEPDVIGPGGVVTFSLRVTNTGSLTAAGTRITDTLPAGFTAVYSEAVGATWDSGTVWTANLAPGASAVITLAAQAPTTPWGPVTQTVFNTVTVSTAAPEHDLTDNQATASVQVIPGPPYTVTLVAVPDTLPVGSLSTLTATVTDQWTNPVLNGTPVTFETSLGALSPPSGWTTTGGAATAQLTSTVAGTAHVTATAGAASGTALVTFTAGGVAYFVFGPIADQVAGVDFTVAITAYDTFGNVAAGFNGTVVLSDVTGSLQPTVSDAFVNGVLASQVVSITVARANQPIRAISGTIQSPSNPFTVTHNLAVVLALSPQNATVQAGQTLAYSAVATDAFGNSWTATSEVTFTTSGGNSFLGTPPGNHVFSATVAGVNFPITGTIAGAGGPVVATTGVTVTPGPAVSLTISPRGAVVTAGDLVTYTAVATDAFGNSWTATSEVTFTTSGGNAFLGTPPGNHVLSATVAGTWPVTGTLGAATDATTITIRPGPVAALALSPVPDPQTAGIPFGLVVTATDRFGNVVDDFSGTLNLTDTTGTLAPTTWSSWTGGVANPSVTVTRAWVADRITVSLAATPTILAVSNPFTVVANVPATVVYTTPASLRVCERAPVTATVTDAYNNPVRDGTVVTFSATIGLVFAESGGTTYVTTTVGGVARATLVAGTLSGSAATWAQAGSANSGPQTVNIITPGLPASVALVVAPAVVEVGGTALVTATVRDCAANPVADGTSVTFTLAPALGTVSPDPAATAGGVALATFTAGTTPGTAVLTATADSRVATATLTLIPGPPHTLTLVVHPTTLVADGSSTAAITATVTDRFGNPVADGTLVTFTLSAPLGTVAPNPAATAGGVALATFTAGTVTGTVVLTATADGAVATATLTLVPIPTHYVYLPLVLRNHGPNLVVESIVWSPTNPAAGEPVVVTVTVRNIGSAAAGTFWVDLYLDPSRTPAPGVPWNEVSAEGVAWRVTGLAPGEARALRSDQGAVGYTFWRGYFAATPNPHRLWAVADSWPYDPAETVPETNEADNVRGPVEVGMR
ncbi:MAG: invasin domain 3-containing protein [Anaerolineae bacterium]